MRRVMSADARVDGSVVSSFQIHAAEIARSFGGLSPGAWSQKLQAWVVRLALDCIPCPSLACSLTFFVNRASDIETEKASAKRGCQELVRELGNLECK